MSYTEAIATLAAAATTLRNLGVLSVAKSEEINEALRALGLEQ